MVEKIPIITFLLTLFFSVLILIMFIPPWKKDKSQEFDNELKYVGFGKRFLAFLIDACIWCVVLYLLKEILLGKIAIIEWVYAITLDIIIDILLFCIAAFFIVKYGGTPGKIVLKIKIMNIYHGGNLSIGRTFLRQLITITSTIIFALQQYYIGSIFMRIDKAVKTNDFTNFYDFRSDVLVLTMSAFILLIILLSDVLLILANRRKRAIHDFLADSIVVQK